MGGASELQDVGHALERTVRKSLYAHDPRPVAVRYQALVEAIAYDVQPASGREVRVEQRLDALPGSRLATETGSARHQDWGHLAAYAAPRRGELEHRRARCRH